MSTLSYLVTVAASQFIISNDPTHSSKLPPVSSSKPGAKILRRLVREANINLPITPFHPCLITSIYDTPVFMFKGKSTKEQGWYLVDNKGTEKNSCILQTRKVVLTI